MEASKYDKAVQEDTVGNAVIHKGYYCTAFGKTYAAETAEELVKRLSDDPELTVDWKVAQ